MAQIVKIAGQVYGLATPDAAGPVYVTSYDGENLDATVLIAFDLSGKVLWRREFRGHPGPPRGSTGGTVWVLADNTLTEVDADGEVARTVTPEREPPEELGRFVLLPDGFCALWRPTERRRTASPDKHARVARYDLGGGCLWSTSTTVSRCSSPATGSRRPS